MRGFSLVELLVVIGIIAVVCALLFPVFARGKEHSQLENCFARMKQVHQADQLYRGDNDDKGFIVIKRGKSAPADPDWLVFDSIKPYLKDASLLRCPFPKPEASKEDATDFYFFRHSPDPASVPGRVLPRLYRQIAMEPRTVFVACIQHASRLGDMTKEIPAGKYSVVYFDGHSRSLDSSALSIQHYANGVWDTDPSGGFYTLKFGDEPWPPSYE